MSLKICCSNVRGIRQSRKRRQHFAYFHRHQFDIIFAQETHSTLEIENIWKTEWGGSVLFSHGTNCSKGVAILFSPRLDFSISDSYSDQAGRYIIVDLLLGVTPLTLICCYGPNLDNPGFFKSVTSKLHDFSCQSIIWGGDFNFVFNLSIDKQGGQPRTNFNSREECLLGMSEHNLIDIWRERNPLTKAYSWHSPSADILCRLDFFLISRSLINKVTNV